MGIIRNLKRYPPKQKLNTINKLWTIGKTVNWDKNIFKFVYNCINFGDNNFLIDRHLSLFTKFKHKFRLLKYKFYDEHISKL